MDTRDITQVIIIATVAVWIIWDIWVAANKTPGDTESEVIRDYTIYPAIPASLGALLGHWTLLGFRVVPDFWLGFMWLCGVGILLVAWSALVIFKKSGKPLASAHEFVAKRPYISVVFGYLAGGLLWGMQPNI